MFLPPVNWYDPMHSIIVTGGSRGLGLAIASNLVAEGFRVIAIARSAGPALQALMADTEVKQRGALHFHAFDLTDTLAISGLVAALRKEYGPIYGLVNNAGLGTSGLLSMMREEDIERLTRINSIAPMVLCKYVLRSMMVERAGRIINIASIVATTGYSGLSVYAATKASLVGLTRSLAREVGQLGITVNAVAPGFVETEMTHGIDESQREKIIRRSALRRMVDPGDVANVVNFLLSDQAKNITGATLTVDAGSTA
jgi:3-oxoacyl-[acyl-carrier protein] reductase